MLRQGSGLTKDQLIATLGECQDALESGMRILGSGVPCTPYGAIDVLALDCVHQLTVVTVGTAPADASLLCGISQVHWVAQNAAILGHMYPNHVIDLPQRPRLVLVAPDFSTVLRASVHQLTAPPVMCVRYHSVSISGRTAIFLESLRTERDVASQPD